MAFFVLAMGGYAQQSQSEIELMQAVFGMEKAQVVMQFVKPGDEYMPQFEALYNEYEEKRKELGKQSFELLTKYADEWEGMTNEQANDLMEKILKLREEREKLITTYYRKIKKETTPIIAMQFYQVEVYILAVIQAKLYDSIPFVGEQR
jgi:hypothetical protein